MSGGNGEMTIVTINPVNEEHILGVMAYAKTVGYVEARVYDSGDVIYALEASHRVEAAKRLGLPLRLVSMEWDDVMETDCDVDTNEYGTAQVSTIFEYAYDNMARHKGGVYSEEDFESVEFL
jgi:hypothetical protein